MRRCSILLLFLAGCSTPPDPFIQVHRIHDPDVGFLNFYVVETSKHCVVIDAGFNFAQASMIRDTLSSIGKPLGAILLTHGHADHYNGAGILRNHQDIPIIATRGILNQIEAYDVIYEARFAATMDAGQYPVVRERPSQILNDRDSLTVDGVTFRLHAYGPGESFDDAVWEVFAGPVLHYFIGDLVLNGVHGFFQSGHSEDWIQSLNRLKRDVPNRAIIHPGHGHAGGFEMFDWQIDYIRKYQTEVNRIAQGRPQLRDDEKLELERQMMAYLPGERLNFLILMSADTMAAEMARGTHSKSN